MASHSTSAAWQIISLILTSSKPHRRDVIPHTCSGTQLNHSTFWSDAIGHSTGGGSPHQSVCWSSITSSILALLDTPALSAASVSVAAAAAVVCFTALDKDEKNPAPPPPPPPPPPAATAAAATPPDSCCWLVDCRRCSGGPGDTAGLGG